MSGQEEGCLPHGERVPYAIPRGQTREPGCTCPVTYFDPTPEPVDVGAREALAEVIRNATAYVQAGRGLVTLPEAQAEAILASDWRTADRAAAEKRGAERALREAERLRAGVKALAAKWAGCWCGQQMAPDHDPRVQDCPQHGDGAADHFGGVIRSDLRALLADAGRGDGSQD